MKTKILCAALSLCLAAGLCACSAEDGKIKDNSEAYRAPSVQPHTVTEGKTYTYERSYDSGNTADHHGNTGVNNKSYTSGDGAANTKSDKNLMEDLERGAENLGRNIKNGAEAVGRDMKNAANNTGTVRGN